jgi:hypothetical protein
MTSSPTCGRGSPRPALELSDVINRHGPKLDGDTQRPLASHERKILTAVSSCRTAALGGHVETCDHCQHQRIAYNSCRNRHCPKCQATACARWMEARANELLPVEYFHVVFTLPDTFNALALANKRLVYGVLFDAVAQTLLEVAANPRNLGAKIGFMAILHTWGQNLSLHPHVHCVVPGGGLSPDGTRWIGCKPGFFLPVRILSRVFRGKFVDLLKRVHAKHPLNGIADRGALECLLNAAVKSDWVVYAKPPFGGPDQVLKYLSRYTHRIAISNHRLVSMDDESVTFRWKDYAHGNRPRAMTLGGDEFLRRFLMHAVPKGFVRIRHFGLLGNRNRTETLARCRSLLHKCSEGNVDPEVAGAAPTGLNEHELLRCPICQRGRMIRGAPLSPQSLAILLIGFDSS